MKAYNEEHREVVQQILDILPTLEEGLQHVIVQLSELRFEESGMLFKDTAEAFASTITSLLDLFGDECQSSTIQSISAMRSSLSQVADAYEGDNVATTQLALEQQLIPSFHQCRKEIEALLLPVISS